MGTLHVEVIARHLQHAAAVQEVSADGAHRGRFRARNALLHVQHQDLVELRHRLGRPVVAVHQSLGRALPPARGQAEAVGHGRLQVEHQAVLAPAGHGVQPRPDQLQRALVALQLAHLEGSQQAARSQFTPGGAEPGTAGHPDQHLQVAQATGALLAVGLQRVGRALVLDMPLLHLQRLGAQEGTRIEHGGRGCTEALEQTAFAGHQPGLQQRRLNRHVALRLGHAFLDRAHRRADLQAGVPAGGDEVRHAIGGGSLRQQHQHVHIGVREEFTPAVAAHGHQRQSFGHGQGRQQVLQSLVHVTGQALEQALSRPAGGPLLHELCDQLGLAFAIAGAQGLEQGRVDGVGHGLAARGACRQDGVAFMGGPQRLRPAQPLKQVSRKPGAWGCPPTASALRSLSR